MSDTVFPVAHTLPAKVTPKPLPPPPCTDHMRTVKVTYIVRGAK